MALAPCPAGAIPLRLRHAPKGCGRWQPARAPPLPCWALNDTMTNAMTNRRADRSRFHRLPASTATKAAAPVAAARNRSSASLACCRQARAHTHTQTEWRHRGWPTVGLVAARTLRSASTWAATPRWGQRGSRRGGAGHRLLCSAGRAHQGPPVCGCCCGEEAQCAPCRSAQDALSTHLARLLQAAQQGGGATWRAALLRGPGCVTAVAEGAQLERAAACAQQAPKARAMRAAPLTPSSGMVTTGSVIIAHLTTSTRGPR